MSFIYNVYITYIYIPGKCSSYQIVLHINVIYIRSIYHLHLYIRKNVPYFGLSIISVSFVWEVDSTITLKRIHDRTISINDGCSLAVMYAQVIYIYLCPSDCLAPCLLAILSSPAVTTNIHYNVFPLQRIPITTTLHNNESPLQWLAITMNLHYNDFP